MSSSHDHKREMLLQLYMSRKPIRSRELCGVDKVPPGVVAEKLRVLAELVSSHYVQRNVVDPTTRKRAPSVVYSITEAGVNHLTREIGWGEDKEVA